MALGTSQAITFVKDVIKIIAQLLIKKMNDTLIAVTP